MPDLLLELALACLYMRIDGNFLSYAIRMHLYFQGKNLRISSCFFLAWVSSIPLCIMNILACLGTWIATKYGLRKATISAALLLGGSFLATSYAKNVDQLFGTFSIPFGFASCVLIMVCNISILIYFDKRLPISNGKMLLYGCYLHLILLHTKIYIVENICKPLSQAFSPFSLQFMFAIFIVHEFYFNISLFIYYPCY